MIEREKLREIA